MDLKEIADMIAEKRKETGRVLVTIDGPCASGKTTLAAKLSAVLRAETVHTDDYVIPHAMKTAERLAVPGGNCDVKRLVKEVVSPWKNGTAVRYQKYDCRGDRMREPEELPECSVLILEGSYSNLPEIRAFADVRIFADTPWELREKRLRERETADSLKRFHERWIPLENAYFEAFGLPDDGCVIIRPL